MGGSADTLMRDICLSIHPSIHPSSTIYMEGVSPGRTRSDMIWPCRRKRDGEGGEGCLRRAASGAESLKGAGGSSLCE
jgi:hypothetical protein